MLLGLVMLLSGFFIVEPEVTYFAVKILFLALGLIYTLLLLFFAVMRSSGIVFILAYSLLSFFW